MNEIDGRPISGVHIPIIEKYLEMRKENPALFDILDKVKEPD